MAIEAISGPLPAVRPVRPSAVRPRTWADRLDAHLAEGDIEGALAEIARGLARQPASVELWLRRARLEAQRGNHDAARAAYEAVTVLSPGQAEATDYFVRRARARGDHAEAVRWLSRRLRLDPTDAETYARRAMALQFCDQPRAAACDAALALALHPDGEDGPQVGAMPEIVAAYMRQGYAATSGLRTRLAERLAELPGDRVMLDRRADRLAEVLDSAARR